MGRKHCGKKRNCSLRAISPFPSVFKRLVSQGCQKVPLCGNGLFIIHNYVCLSISADDNFKFDENSRKLSKWVENWKKEKLLVTSNFSFSHSVFKRPVSQGRQKLSLCGNGLNVQFYSFFEYSGIEIIIR